MARAAGIMNAVNVGIAVQADWENREFISHISLHVHRLFDFLLRFGQRHNVPFVQGYSSIC
ncbi:Protein BRICK like [Actinidia chinensis var. chinensis]|uniref:Protein BRICK like n=1 Tax=Actinidia chinensis var. chinensis TaxID=1590841 RepID=A0A2R6PA28_ACTCC|nr:Protein BRICK like [Actinidia chinensis var. chinensis]